MMFCIKHVTHPIITVWMDFGIRSGIGVFCIGKPESWEVARGKPTDRINRKREIL